MFQQLAYKKTCLILLVVFWENELKLSWTSFLLIYSKQICLGVSLEKQTAKIYTCAECPQTHTWRLKRYKWVLHSLKPRVLFFAYSLSGSENKPMWTLLHLDASASQRGSPVEEGDRVGYLWVINTCRADRPLLCESPGSFPRLTSVCRCSRSLDCGCRAGWDAHCRSGRVLLEAVRGYVNNSGTRHSGRRNFWLYFLYFLLFFLPLLPSVIRNTKQKWRNMKLNQTRWRFTVEEWTVHVGCKLQKKNAWNICESNAQISPSNEWVNVANITIFLI